MYNIESVTNGIYLYYPYDKYRVDYKVHFLFQHIILPMKTLESNQQVYLHPA